MASMSTVSDMWRHMSLCWGRATGAGSEDEHEDQLFRLNFLGTSERDQFSFVIGLPRQLLDKYFRWQLHSDLTYIL